MIRKGFLYATEFFAGMSVMAVELCANRLLAPYFSSSQIVWTIIIATIMIAMALGNIWGGKSADKNPDPDRLYIRLLIAAVWIAATPFLGKYVILLSAGLLVAVVNQNFLVTAAFASSLIIFVFPCFLLGTCTPSLSRYIITGAEDSGRTVGKLGAFNTVGSIIGTFLPTFVTIPSIGSSMTFVLFSGILLVLSLAYFLHFRRKMKACVTAAVLIAAFCAADLSSGFAFGDDHLVYEGESVYNYLQVSEDSESVILSTNVLFGVQSVLMKNGDLTGMYYDYALAAPLLSRSFGQNEGLRVLVLGMGSGTFAAECMKYFPGAEITGVEIDDQITDLARRYFELPGDIPVVSFDGRAYVSLYEDTYDVILVDAYQDITIPFHMSSAEFFALVKKRLNPGGILAVNMNMRSSAPDGICAYLADTAASVFPHVLEEDVPLSTNRLLFASEEEISGELLLGRCEKLENEKLRDLMIRSAGKLTVYEGGDRILTDDRAPVELLGMKAIDDIIREEVQYYRRILREEGPGALLSAFA